MAKLFYRPTTKIFYDTEFHENGSTIDLISIGLVREDGAEYYAVSSEFDFAAVYRHPWLRENVVPYLPTTLSFNPPTTLSAYVDLNLDLSHPDVKPRAVIAQEVKAFVLELPDPELWAYYGAYDHVALCQLYGRMIDLPDGFPMFTNDIRQVMRRLAKSRDQLPNQSSNNHKAIDDARWNKLAHHELTLRTNDWGVQDI